jgi:uncharacterized protein YkwD
MKTFSRQFFNISILLLLVFSVNSLAQTEAKTKKPNFETLAAVNDKNEIARPRLAEEKKENSAKPVPVAVLINKTEFVRQLERKAFDLLNEKRKEQGLTAVQWSEDVAKVARQHSESMAVYKFFSHTGLDGSMVNDRADALGLSRWKAIGENIAYNRGYDNPVEFACQRWMQSQSHRENILNPRWKEAGIGVAVTTEGTYYFTQVFVLR